MARPRLILVEGIPGSGKTSTACYVRDWLERYGTPARLYLEGDWDHPADFESVACLTEADMADLRARFPAQESFLAQHGRQDHGMWFFSYRRLQAEHEAEPDALFEVLSGFDVYNLPAERFQELQLAKWRAFAADAVDRGVTYVFECCLLQNPITTLLAYHSLPAECVRRHIEMLAEIVRPLTPKLIYLARRDVAATLETVRRERPQAWADHVIRYLTEQAYGEAHNLSGFDGVIEFYARRQAFELELLPSLPFSSAVIGDEGDWAARHEAVAACLSDGWVQDERGQCQCRVYSAKASNTAMTLSSGVSGMIEWLVPPM